MLILASQSKIRAEILDKAGVLFKAVPSGVDEEAIKSLGLTPEALPMRLAEAKALAVSKLYPEDFILGADQVLVLQHEILGKPKDVLMARAQLLKLRGNVHRLVSALAIVRSGEVIWRDQQQAKLMMRVFSEQFLDYYLETMGDRVLFSVGGYQYENLGAQLFSQVDGDFRTIMGLPIEGLFGFLRQQGILWE